jgi:hypothetical protein
MAFEKRSVISQVFGMTGLAVSLFLFAGTVFSVVALSIYRAEAVFAAERANVVGVVHYSTTNTFDCRQNGSAPPKACSSYSVVYLYEAEGKQRVGITITNGDTNARMKTGTRIMVRYLRSDPSKVRTTFDPERVDVDDGDGWLYALSFGGLGGVYLLIGGAGVVWLRKTGTAQGAVVLAQDETNVQVNHETQWIKWKDDSGTLGQSLGQAGGNLPPVGARIEVYADPASQQLVWEGDIGPR